jgi:metal-dependent HD superfamily phosphatase/phosphodiesterase
VSEHQDPRPRDDTDAVRDIARDLADVAHQISSFKGEANAYLSDQNYNPLRLRLENAHAAVEAATVKGRRVRLNKGDRKRG